MSDHPKKMNVMDSLPSLTVIEQSQVSPPPATIGLKSLLLTFSDIVWLTFAEPVHTLFFMSSQSLKHSSLKLLSPILNNLYLSPFNIFSLLLVSDSVAVTFAECNLDFNDLTGNHPRECEKFYHLIPLLGRTTKVSDYITIPVFAVQVTLFPNCGISIGITNHHSLGDASTTFCFLKAWTSVAQYNGSDENFLAKGTLPIYDRLVNYPKLDEINLKKAKVEAFNEEYKLPRLCGPTDKVRATFILSRTMINGLKKLVSTQIPTLAYLSSFTIACAYIWNCVASLHNDEIVLFGFAIDCRSRMDPPIPAAYFGNFLGRCINVARTSILTGKDGFLAAAELIGENLNKILTDKDGLVKGLVPMENMFADGWPTRMMGVAGSPKHKLYDLDFGFGKPKKHEWVSIDYNVGSISISTSRESNEDLEIGLCLSAAEMDLFVSNFNSGLKSYI
ncbi:putative anthocyanin 6''-O-malonyltransferase [Helianthus annuus]|nr:putative anthocyanin 6''-O-malonyltransferase [Helianthus annuus]